MKPRALRCALATFAVCVATACGDREVTEPAVGVSPTSSLSKAGDASEVVAILKRKHEITAESVTGVIGPKGGHLQLDRAGMRIEFAPGALRVPTRITVSAAPGRDVAYTFEPHGTVFGAPVTIRQNLRNTTAWKNPRLAAQLQGSYFDTLFVDQTRTYARSKEKRPATLRDGSGMLEFNVEHFSGYMISTGKSGVEIEVEIEAHIR